MLWNFRNQETFKRQLVKRIDSENNNTYSDTSL